jgi:hypothetical protein
LAMFGLSDAMVAPHGTEIKGQKNLIEPDA